MRSRRIALNSYHHEIVDLGYYLPLRHLIASSGTLPCADVGKRDLGTEVDDAIEIAEKIEI